MRHKRSRIDTSGSAGSLEHTPFSGLDSTALPATTNPTGKTQTAPENRARQQRKNRGRIDVTRQTAGRGGKTVTVLAGFKGIARRELDEIARSIQKACGVGGTVRSTSIEIQGDQRDRVCQALEEAGFRPVQAGG